MGGVGIGGVGPLDGVQHDRRMAAPSELWFVQVFTPVVLYREMNNNPGIRWYSYIKVIFYFLPILENIFFSKHLMQIHVL